MGHCLLLIAHWLLLIACCLFSDHEQTTTIPILFYRRYENNNLFSACSLLLWNWFIFGFSISVILHTCLKLVTMEEFLQKTFQSGEVPASVRQLFTGMSSTHLKYITFTGTAVVVFRYQSRSQWMIIMIISGGICPRLESRATGTLQWLAKHPRWPIHERRSTKSSINTNQPQQTWGWFLILDLV